MHFIVRLLPVSLLIAATIACSGGTSPAVAARDDGGNADVAADGGGNFVPTDRSAFNVDVCTVGDDKTPGGYNPLTGVTLASADAYLELSILRPGPKGGQPQPLSGSVGTACKAAPNAAACQSELLAARGGTESWKLTRSCGGAGCQVELYVLVLEQNGVVQTVRTREELVAALGAIDSPQKAALVASFGSETLFVACTGNQVRTNPDGSYSVFLERPGDTCNPQIEFTLAHRSQRCSDRSRQPS